MKHRYQKTAAALVVFIFALSVPSLPNSNQSVQAVLISEKTSVRPGHSFWIGVLFRMKEGWHIYWKNPGDSGLSTRVKWDLSHELKQGPLLWPYPKRFETSSLVTFGYEREVLLLSQITPCESLQTQESILLKAQTDWLACKEGCVFGEADLVLELPVKDEKPARDPEWSEIFDSARDKLPQPVPGWSISASADQNTFILQIQSPAAFQKSPSSVQFFPLQNGLIDHSKPDTFHMTNSFFRLKAALSQQTVTLPTRVSGILFSETGWGDQGRIKALFIDVPLKSKK